MTRKLVLGSVGGTPFSLKAFAKTKGKSTCLSSITPKKFDKGDKVRHLDSQKNPCPNVYTVMAFEWYSYINTWFYELLPGMWTNESCLVAA